MLHEETHGSVLFSPAGRSLVTASGDEYAIWNVGSWTRRLQIPRSQATGLPGWAAYSPAGGVLAIATTRSLVQLVDAESGLELVTLEAPEPKSVSSLGFSPDGRLLAVALHTAGIKVWDLRAIGRELESLGLHWSIPTGAGQAALAPLAPKRIIVEDAPWKTPLVRGEELARLGRWEDAAAAFEEAHAKGARHVDAQARRVLPQASAGGGKGEGWTTFSRAGSSCGCSRCPSGCRVSLKTSRGRAPSGPGPCQTTRESFTSPRWPPASDPTASG